MRNQFIQGLKFEAEDLLNTVGNMSGELSQESIEKALKALEYINEAHILLCQIECDEEEEE